MQSQNDYTKIQIQILDIGFIFSLLMMGLFDVAFPIMKYTSGLFYLDLLLGTHVYIFFDSLMNNEWMDTYLYSIISPFSFLTIYCFILRIIKASQIGKFYHIYIKTASIWKSAGIRYSVLDQISNLKESISVITGKNNKIDVIDTKSFISDFIKNNRDKAFMTQQHLADACDISLKTIQRAERNGAISKENLRAVCSVLNISLPDIKENTERTFLNFLYDSFFSFNINNKILILALFFSIVICSAPLIFAFCISGSYEISKNTVDYPHTIILLAGLSLIPLFILFTILVPSLFNRAPQQKKAFLLGIFASFIMFVPISFFISNIGFFQSNHAEMTRNLKIYSEYSRFYKVSKEMDLKNAEDKYIYKLLYLRIAPKILLEHYQDYANIFPEYQGETYNVDTLKKFARDKLQVCQHFYNTHTHLYSMDECNQYIDHPENLKKLDFRIDQLSKEFNWEKW